MKDLAKSSKTYQTIQNQDKQNHAYIVINCWVAERPESLQLLQHKEDKTSHGWSPSFSLVLLDILVHLLTRNLRFSINRIKAGMPRSIERIPALMELTFSTPKVIFIFLTSLRAVAGIGRFVS